MNGIVLDDGVLERLRERNPRFQEMAYVFVLSALHYVLQHLTGTRHISGRELTEGVRDLAREQFGPMARTVLEHWGIRETGDVGDVVFALVEAGILIKQDEDTRAEFEDVYDFNEAFQTNYPGSRPASA
ncbi:MAG: Minf_1886 family protein [Longimicrobiales bacterium]